MTMNFGVPTGYRQQDLFGGSGEVLVWDLWGRRELAPFRAVLACELAPGATVGAHVQQECPEIVVFTSGEGRVEVNGEGLAVSAGLVVPLALGSVLAIANTSTDQHLHYMIIKAAIA